MLIFIFTPDTGLSLPGKTYEAWWCDQHGNVHVCYTPFPQIFSYFFDRINAVEMHSHGRQRDLDLEQSWVTRDTYFSITNTLFGVVVIDAWKEYWYHLHHKHQENSMIERTFAFILEDEMSNNNFRKLWEEDVNTADP